MSSHCKLQASNYLKTTNMKVLHTTLSVALIVAILFLTSLITFNFMVLKKVNDIQPVLEVMNSSPLSKLKQESASKIVEIFNQKRQVLVTTQTLAMMLMLMLGFRLCALISCIYPPQEGSKLSFLRRTNEEIQFLFQDDNKGKTEMQDMNC